MVSEQLILTGNILMLMYNMNTIMTEIISVQWMSEIISVQSAVLRSRNSPERLFWAVAGTALKGLLIFINLYRNSIKKMQMQTFQRSTGTGTGTGTVHEH